MTLKRKMGLVLLWMLAAGSGGCDSDVINRVGVSTSGFIVAIEAFSGNAGLPADGTSQATVRVEVFTSAGQVVDGESITLTTTKGTLGSSTLTTSDGVATTTLTSDAVPGTAFIVATVENVSATTAVQFVNFSAKAS
ncbi:MAG: Ig-like domain-containing protein [Nitrospinales bacterium]